MSKKSDKLVTTLVDACYLDGGHWGDTKDVTAAQEALAAYIDGLHARITCLHTANNNQADMLGRQALLVARWRNRAIALGHIGPESPTFRELKAQAAAIPPDPEVDVGPGSSPVPDTYQGHAGTTGGLQAHSVGELYPYIIVKQGDLWHVDHASDGRQTIEFGYQQQEEAVRFARWLKDNYA